MKSVLKMCLFTLLSVPTFVSAAPIDPADKYFSNKTPALTPQEKAALAIAKQWESNSPSAIKPTPGANGAIMFVYGNQQPSVVCAVLQVCDVALQEGEQVNSINLGDPARWNVEPAITGSGAQEIQHLIIKPMDVGLETSLIVATNRRAYYFKLRSHRTEYMPQIRFTYPDEANAKWEMLRTQETRIRETKTIPETQEYLGDLSFDYDISGSAPWKPVRVYHNDQKTIIQMPKAMAQTEAPTLLVVRNNGGAFKADETVQVNYRIQGDRYIVDTVFDRALLVAGVGRSQTRVMITRRK